METPGGGEKSKQCKNPSWTTPPVSFSENGVPSLQTHLCLNLQRQIVESFCQQMRRNKENPDPLTFPAALGKWMNESCSVVCDPIDCPPGPSVHGILQARVLEWVAMPFSRDQTQVSHIAGGFFTVWARLWENTQGYCGKLSQPSNRSQTLYREVSLSPT